MEKRKLGRLLISLALILSLVISSTVTASAATVKINKQKASLYSGSVITLKISNTSKKVTWTTSNKSVATVKSTGTKTAKVTAKLAGKATVTAKVGGKKFKCTVTVKKKLGTKSYPISAANGITYDTNYGTVNYRVTNTYVGDDADAYFKEIWPEDWDFIYNQGMIFLYPTEGRKLVALEYEFGTPSGYEQWPVEGNEIINPNNIYDKKCSKLLSQPILAEGDVSKYVEEIMCSGTDEYLSHYSMMAYTEGNTLKMAVILLVPEKMTSFTTYNTDKNNKKIWVKYSLSK